MTKQHLYAPFGVKIFICSLVVISFLNTRVFAQESVTERELGLFVTRAIQQREKANYDSSGLTLNEALHIAKQSNSKAALARINSELGVLNIYESNYAAALSNVQTALLLYEQLHDSVGMARSFNSMGSIYYFQREFVRAKDNYAKALHICEKGTDQRALANTLNNMGAANSEMGEFAKALEFHERSLVIWEEMGSSSGQAVTLEDMGNCLIGLGRLEEALPMLLKSETVAKKTHNERSVVLLDIEIGELMWSLQRYKESLTWCDRAYLASKQNGFKYEQQRSCLCLFKTHGSLNDAERSLLYYQRYIALRDSSSGQEMTKEITALEMNYAFKKQQMADSLRFVAEAQLQESKLQQQRIGLVSTGGLLILAIALVLAIHHGKRKSEALLLNILPQKTAEELKRNGKAESKYYDSATVLFTDFVGFTSISEKLTPQELVQEIHACFSAFDQICDKFGIEKIKTIGDAYMAVGGVPAPSEDSCRNTILAALEMQTFICQRKEAQNRKGISAFDMRLGIHTGPVVAGIVGVKKFQYDIWGDTVNTASRMESSGAIGRVNVSEATYACTKSDFRFQFRGEVEVKGKGKVRMYFVQEPERV